MYWLILELNDWFLNWMIDYWIEWLILELNDWFLNWMIDWLIDWLVTISIVLYTKKISEKENSQNNLCCYPPIMNPILLTSSIIYNALICMPDWLIDLIICNSCQIYYFNLYQAALYLRQVFLWSSEADIDKADIYW